MNKLLFPILLLSLHSHAQIKRAIVCDSSSKESLPSASIRLKNTSFGTLTNNDGRFSMNARQGVFQFSYIGFKTKEIAVNALPDTVFLAENNILNEIIIMPDSALKVLLRNAYNSISKNYSQIPTLLTGFYREVNENVDSSRFNYFSESILKIYKPPYTIAGSGHQGQVQVLKTRKVVHPSYEKLGIRFYGGPFAATKRDHIQNRSSYINPKYFKDYNYKLEKISSYNDNQVYVIKFNKKDSLFEGKIYIDRKSLAYIKFESFQVLNKKEINFKRIDSKASQIFESKNNLWYLIYDSYEGNNKNNKGVFSLLSEYVTTQIEIDSVNAISFNDQFEDTGVISREENNISENFFDEYNSVLEQTNELKDQVNSTFRTNSIDSLRKTLHTQNRIDSTSKIIAESNKKKIDLRKIKSKLTFSLGTSYAPFNTFDFGFQSTLSKVFEEPKTAEIKTKATDLPILINYMYRYQLNKRWAIMKDNAKTVSKISNSSIIQEDYGMAYRFIIHPERKLRFIEPSIKYSNITYGVSYGNFKNPERGVIIDNKKFKAKNLTSGIFHQTKGIKLGVSTNIYSRKTMKLAFNLDYLIPIKTSEPYFQLAENRNFLSYLLDKKVRIDLNDTRLNITNLTSLKLPEIKNNFWIGLNYRRFL